MSEYYFSSEEHRIALQAACKAREGTPFREGMSAPGLGYDCAHLVRDCFNATGLDTSAFDACPSISLNAGRLSSTSALILWLRTIGKDYFDIYTHAADTIPEFMCGDILCIHERLSCNHLALAEGPDWAWHVPYGGVVSRVPVSLFRPRRRDMVEMVCRLKEVSHV